MPPTVTHQWYQQDRVYRADAIAMALCASMPGGSYWYLIDDNLQDF